jgi:hypothetical protein
LNDLEATTLCLWTIPFGPMTPRKLFALCLAETSVLGSVAESLEIPAHLYENYEYKFQKAFPAEVIASKFDFIKDMDSDTISQCDLFVKGLQFNVQTLRSHVKRNAFLTIFKHNGYAFACLQETRSNKTCIKVVDDVIMCSSAGADGNHGCEVFINSKSPWARVHDKPVSICRNDVCIMFADHRSIIVCISNKHLHMYIISAHAPYVGCHEDPTTWWKMFQRNLLKFCKVGAPVVLGIDANYQSHVSMSSGMGDLNILNCSPPQP